MHIPLILTTFLSLTRFVVGWGADTHPTIGYLAENFLLDETVLFPLNGCGVDFDIETTHSNDFGW